MRASVLLELGLEHSGGDDAPGLAEAVRQTAQAQLQESGVRFGALEVDVSACRVVLRIRPPSVVSRSRASELVDVLQAVLQRLGQDCAWNERPLGESLRWLVALQGTQVLPLTFEELRAGRTSQGHCRLAPGPVQVASAAQHAEALRGVQVWVGAAEREGALRRALAHSAAALEGTCSPDEGLLSRWVARSEAPRVHAVTLCTSTDGWPRGLARAALAESVEAFAAEGTGAGPLRACLCVVDGAPQDDELEGLRERAEAHLGQLASMLQRDRSTPLDEHAHALAQRPYHARLGSLADQQRRALALALHLAPVEQRQALSRLVPWLGAERASEVAQLHPELRGELGCWLARVHGLSPELSVALDYGAFDPADAPAGELSLRRAALALADSLDTVVGAYAIGLGPTGTVDALGVRPAARQFARLALTGRVDVHLGSVLRAAWAAHGPDAKEAMAGAARAGGLLRRELAAALGERVSKDVLEAALAAWHDGWVSDLADRAAQIALFAAQPQGRLLLLSLKRCYAWTRDVMDGQANPELLDPGAEWALWEASQRLAPAVARALSDRDAAGALSAIAGLAEPLERFFSDVSVASAPPGRAENRLQLLASIVRITHRVAHFHLLSLEES